MDSSEKTYLNYLATQRSSCKIIKALSCKYRSIYNKDHPDQVSEPIYEGCKTIWDLFQRSVRKFHSKRFLGTRNPNKEGKPYEWKTYRQIYDEMDLFARGLN